MTVAEKDKEMTPEEKVHADAVAMGDIIEEPKADETVPNEPVKDEPDPGKKEEYSIPKARFDELSGENKALKERLLALEETVKAKAPVQDDQPNQYQQMEEKRDALQDQADQMLVEGDLDGRKAVLKEIRSIDRELSKAELMYEVNQRMAQKETAASMESVISQAYEAYPFLDTKSDSFDGDAVAAINAYQQALIEAGQSPAAALQSAVAEKGPKFAKLLGTTNAQVDELKAAREKQAREKAAATSTAQPASLPARTEKNSFISDTARMTAAQILALPEAERARAMGDTL